MFELLFYLVRVYLICSSVTNDNNKGVLPALFKENIWKISYLVVMKEKFIVAEREYFKYDQDNFCLPY